MSQLSLELGKHKKLSRSRKVVTKKLKDGRVRRYYYWQLVRVWREGGKVKTEYVKYCGKVRPPLE